MRPQWTSQHPMNGGIVDKPLLASRLSELISIFRRASRRVNAEASTEAMRLIDFAFGRVWVIITFALACEAASLTLFSCGNRNTSASGNCVDKRSGRFFPDASLLHRESALNDGRLSVTSSNEECCKLCRETPGCRAWVRIKQSRPSEFGLSGSCWLQSAVPTPDTSVKGMDSGIVKPIGGCTAGPENVARPQSCQRNLSRAMLTDVPYNSPELLFTQSAKECCGRCQEQSQLCGHWAWDKAKKFCSLYARFPYGEDNNECENCSTGITEANKNVRRLRECTNGEPGVGYFGKQVLVPPGALRAESPEQCCGICASVRECRSWSWNMTSAECALNGDIPEKTNSTETANLFGGISTPKVCRAETCARVDGVRMEGSDLNNILSNVPKGNNLVVDSPEECCVRCQEFQGCKGWTFLRDNTTGSTECWLKHDVPFDGLTAACKGQCYSGIVISRVSSITLQHFQTLATIAKDGNKELKPGRKLIMEDLECPEPVGQTTSFSLRLILGILGAFCLSLCLSFSCSLYLYTRARRRLVDRNRQEAPATADQPPGEARLDMDQIEGGLEMTERRGSDPYDLARPDTEGPSGSVDEGATTSLDVDWQDELFETASEGLPYMDKVQQLITLKSFRESGEFFEGGRGLSFGSRSLEVGEESVEHALKDIEEGSLLAGKYVVEGGYEVDECTVVVAARQTNGNGTPVLVKFFTAQEAFESEISFLDRQVASEYTPQVFDRFSRSTVPPESYNLPSCPCIVMERGVHTLAELLARQDVLLDKLDEQTILYKISSAVSFLHEQRVVHRNLKPSSLVMFRNLSWKIVDFTAWSSRGHYAPIQYTLRYAPPEVMVAHADGETEIIARPSADMWALGLVFWEVLTGTPLFSEEYTDEEVMAMLLGVEPLPFEKDPDLWATLQPKSARQLTQRLLKRKPLSRWPIQKVLADTYFSPAGDGPSAGQTSRAAEAATLPRIVENQVLQEIGIENLKQAAGPVLITCFSLYEVPPAVEPPDALTKEEVIDRFRKGDLHCTEAILTEFCNKSETVMQEPCCLLRLDRAHLIKITLISANERARDMQIRKVMHVRMSPSGGASDYQDCRFFPIVSKSDALEGIVYWDTPTHEDASLHGVGDASVDVAITVKVRGYVEAIEVRKTLRLKMHMPDETFEVVDKSGHTEDWISHMSQSVGPTIHGLVAIVSIPSNLPDV